MGVFMALYLYSQIAFQACFTNHTPRRGKRKKIFCLPFLSSITLIFTMFTRFPCSLGSFDWFHLRISACAILNLCFELWFKIENKRNYFRDGKKSEIIFSNSSIMCGRQWSSKTILLVGRKAGTEGLRSAPEKMWKQWVSSQELEYTVLLLNYQCLPVPH